MRGLTAAAPALAAPPDLTARTFAALDARLMPDTAAPVCVAVSGGGDSMALLALACDWAVTRGRRVLALSVDHGLQSDSAAWSALALEAAARLGADARLLRWTGDKPTTGLPAAARRARHALLAEAVREAGACVLLMAHTADDVTEADVMRAKGSTLGDPRDWAPSPIWPEGRGVFVLRPLLDASRAELRAHLAARGLGWIDDPANEDPRFARARARLSLRAYETPGLRSESLAVGRRVHSVLADGSETSVVFRGPVGAEVLGAIQLKREDLFVATHSARLLAAACLCAAGTTRPPRTHSLDRLLARLHAGGAFAATLAGARIQAAGEQILFARDAGEFDRRALPPLSLEPGTVSVWDGRFEIAADEPGWSVVPLKGQAARLDPADRRAVNACSPIVRPSLPVLIRSNGTRPVLATRAALVRPLALERFHAACGLIAHEATASVAPELPATYVGAFSGS